MNNIKAESKRLDLIGPLMKGFMPNTIEGKAV